MNIPAGIILLALFMMASYMKAKTDMRYGPSTTHFKRPSKLKPQTSRFKLEKRIKEK